MPSPYVRKPDRTGRVISIVAALWLVFALAWVSFIVWAIYSVVTWLVAQ